MKISARLLRFVLIGTAAAATHFAVVWAVVAAAGLPPLVANVIGWVVAFAVSFGGHFAWTFADQQAPIMQAMQRFAAVSLAGFVVNESLYALLLHGGVLGYRSALVVVLLMVAVMTYVLSRFWAFRSKSVAPTSGNARDDGHGPARDTTRSKS